MIDMKKTTLILSLALASVAVFCSCSEKAATESADAGESAGMFFKAAKRQGGGSGDLTRLYIAERLQEHDNGEALHCSMIVDLTPSSDGLSWSYSLTDMTAQWYKFAFVSVPDNISYSPGETGASGVVDGASMFSAEDGCDFNSIVIDYSQVLEAQQADVTLSRDENTDLHVYRKIIDRWLLPDMTLTEDVTMDRITGRLIVDMGIPEDQFPREVESISISMRAPTVVYLHDEADGSVLLKDYSEENFIFEYTDIPWNRREPFRIILDLLPSEISADVTVKYAGSNEGVYYQLVSSDGKVSVKPATRTTVVFNGISDGFREIRYAGFPDDGDAVVDVAPDRWD